MTGAIEDNLAYYIDTDEIPGVFILLKNYIFIGRSEDTIFIFHVRGIGVAIVTTR